MKSIPGHTILAGAALALGALALSGAAEAQRPPPPANFPDMVNHNPILYSGLGLRGPGGFTGVLDPKTDELCYMLNVPGLADVTAAHIHQGMAGQDGNVVLPLKTPADGSSGGCATVPADLAAKLVANPADYYVNVHTKEYPAGAVRGQLKKYDPNKMYAMEKPAKKM